MTRRMLFPLAALSIVLAPSTGRADACAGDDTCPKGFVCQSVAAPQPAIACAPNTECPAPPPATEIKSCLPAPCKADSDCAEGMICYTSKHTECTDVARPTADCPPDQKCEAPPASCTEATVSLCTPKWALPCQQDLDCGVGFTCEPNESCQCSGSGGSDTPVATPVPPPPPGSSGGGSAPSSGGSSGPTPAADEPPAAADGGAAPPRPVTDSSCVCTKGFPGFCRPKEITCETAKDCPTTWTCEASAAGVSAGCAVPAPGPDGTTTPTKCEPPPPPPPSPNMCMPPYADVYGYGVASDIGAPGAPTAVSGGGGVTAESAPVPLAGPTPPPSSSPTPRPSPTNKFAPNATDTMGGNGGCSFGGGGGQASFAAIAGLAIAALLRRRRRSR